jgi:hypothetical protein
VSAQDLSPVGGVTLVTDRLTNSQGSFQTPSNSYAQAPSGLYFASGSFTITMWLQNQNSGNYKSLFGFSSGVGTDDVAFITNLPGGGYCSPYPSYMQFDTTGGAYSQACSTASFTNGLWYHVAFVGNNTSLTSYIYVNGTLVTTAGSQLALRNVTRTFNYFGKDGFGNYGNWLFDEIKFHGRALTAQEVLNDFNKNQTYLIYV